MVLLGDEGMETQNLVRGRAQQEMEMECDTLHEKILHEVEKEKGQQKGKGTHQEMETEAGMGMVEENPVDWEDKCMPEEEDYMDGESENGVEVVGVEEINNTVGGYNEDMPPVDDVCPICFDRFTIPCRSNCGHWFCANCILQFWMFRSSIRPCKCPFCCCRIVNLKPEMSQLTLPADAIVEVLKKVHQYNGLYVKGVHGAFQRVRALPLFMGRIFRVLIDPDGMRCIYYVTRLLGLFLALLYERGEFEFIPTGGLGIQRTFDLSASLLVLTLFFIGIGYRCVLKGRARHLAAIQAWDS